MRLLDRHILAELIGPFVFGVAAFTSLMFAGKELFKITELLAEYGAPLHKAVELTVLHLPSLIVITLPMAMLLAALLGFGRLSGDSEVVALFASGVSLYRIAVPVIVMAVVVTGLSFTLSEVIAPRSNYLHEQIVRDLKGEARSSDKPFSVVDAPNGVTNSIAWVQGGFDMKTSTLREVSMIRYWENRPAIFVYAKKAVYKDGNKWQFMNGYSQTLGGSGRLTLPFENSEVEEIELSKTPDQLALYQKKHDELSFSELREYVRMMQKEGADVNKDRVRLYQKIALPMATLVFALIGTPLGLRPHRSSSAMGLGLAIVIIFAYWILMHYMTILGNNGAVSPAAASFIPTLVGAAAGVALIVRAAK